MPRSSTRAICETASSISPIRVTRLHGRHDRMLAAGFSSNGQRTRRQAPGHTLAVDAREANNGQRTKDNGQRTTDVPPRLPRTTLPAEVCGEPGRKACHRARAAVGSIQRRIPDEYVPSEVGIRHRAQRRRGPATPRRGILIESTNAERTRRCPQRAMSRMQGRSLGFVAKTPTRGRYRHDTWVP